MLVGARKECPLIVGRGDGEQFLASAHPRLPRATRATSSASRTTRSSSSRPRASTFLHRRRRAASSAQIDEVDWDEETAEKGGYETFMLKEIHEQADAVAETIADRTARADGVDLGDLGAIDDELLRDVKRIVIVACGTSYHAGLIGRYAIEEWARVPVEMDIASEYRYRNPVVGPGDLVIGITQSGETADTLAAMRLARERGATVLAVTNVMGSQATRDADGVLFTRAGPRDRRRRDQDVRLPRSRSMYLLGAAARRAARHARRPSACTRARRRAQAHAAPHRRAARRTVEPSDRARSPSATSDAEFFLYLGRHVGLPVAPRGRAEAQGDLLHRDRRLRGRRDEARPDRAARRGARRSSCVATDSPVLEKVISNMQEVRARGAHVIAVATEGNRAIGEHAEEVVCASRATDWMLQPLLAVIPLQLLAYRIARLRGLNVDQPRNLAKTVTVE